VKSAKSADSKIMTFTRTDNRAADELRAVKITPDFLANAEGSALIEMGNTRVICAASVEEKLPPHLRGQRTEGWVTAEYGMLPRSTHTRTNREIGRGGPSGRTHEIQRLIGRSLRAIANRKVLGERTITLDCDVLQADGGTRTAAITGAYVAFAIACRRLMKEKRISKSPIISEVAAISVGIVDGAALLDLKYDEDSRAEVDMNIVCAGDGRFIEVQGTAEGLPFTREQMDELLELGRKGIEQLVRLQRQAIDAAGT
jgi:ribonuclease PH